MEQLQKLYYNKLDVTNKCLLLDVQHTRCLVNRIEISIEKFSKEKFENKEMELEILSSFIFFFSANPLLKTKAIYDLDQVFIVVHKKVKIYNQRIICDMLTKLIRDFDMSEKNVVINERRKDGTFSIIYEIQLSYTHYSSQFPNILLEKTGYEIPTIKVEIFFNNSGVDCCVGSHYPFWFLLQLKSFDNLEN